MSLFDIHEIQELAASSGGPHVSLYMSAVKAGPQTRQNSIRYKNLLDRATAQLHESGLTPEQTERLLTDANRLRLDNLFWQAQDHGLAVLINETGMHTYHLPRELPEEARVNDRFFLTPLLQFLYEGGDFYILTLDQSHIRLLKGTPYQIEEVPLDDHSIPTSLEDGLPGEDPQREFNWRPRTADPSTNVPGERPTQLGKGLGAGDDEPQQSILLRYFQKLDKGITSLLKDSRPPLVLAGVDHLLPIYKQASSYPNLVEDAITQHPRAKQAADLHQQAWKIVKPIFDEARQASVDRYRLLKGRKEQTATGDLKEVVKAAPFGRVEILFIDKNARGWGSYDNQKNQVRLVAHEQPGSQDLIEFCAIETLRNGGTVYAVDATEMPGNGEPIAAILRY